MCCLELLIDEDEPGLLDQDNDNSQSYDKQAGREAAKQARLQGLGSEKAPHTILVRHLAPPQRNAPRGIYSGRPEKFPPPLKFFPVFVDFLRSFKLHKGILACVLSLFSFLPPFPFLFH